MTHLYRLIAAPACAMFMVLPAVGALAQTPPAPVAAPATGVDGPVLQKAIEANAEGKCPEDIMSADLLAACKQQIAMIQPMLTAKGKITKLEFLSFQAFPGGQAEMWRVNYEHGTSQVWGIAVGPDGKIMGMGTRDA